MKKPDKIIFFFYIFLGISFVTGFLYIDSQYNELDLQIIPEEITNLSYVVETEVDHKKIFNVMTDVVNYPKILPKNVDSIKVIEYGENFIIAEETFSERGIQITNNVKHTIIPYEIHTIEILDGDAKGTRIIQTFSTKDSHTKIISEIELNFKGILTPFLLIPQSNFIHALDTVHSSFIIYAANYDDSFKRIVDELYREILLRPVDPQGLEYYSLLLKNNMTKNELRQLLLDSPERKSLELSGSTISLDDLKPETKSTINDIYVQMLHRDADIDGLLFFGNQLEKGLMTKPDIESSIFESEEGTRIRLDSWAKQKINDAFLEILSRPATLKELNHYESLIQTKELSENDLKIILSNNTKLEIIPP